MKLKKTKKFVDIVVLTDSRYIAPTATDQYTLNVLQEDRLVTEALQNLGLKVERRSWDDPEFNWSSAKNLLFRTTWDYFERFAEFEPWLKRVSKECTLINPEEVIFWNLDKHYLKNLSHKGVNIAPTIFIERGEQPDLYKIMKEQQWNEAVFKPCVSGAGRHTYRLKQEAHGFLSAELKKLMANESFMLQEFQHDVVNNGEISLMIIGGEFTHAVLKIAKSGDFRVQDDFGGKVISYTPNADEIAFARQCVQAAGFDLTYARVDIFRDNKGQLALAELELIEPEMWFRFHPEAATILARAVAGK